MFVCCECRVLSGRGLCDELITRREESYRRWCVVVCDLETSRMRRPWPALDIYRKSSEQCFVRSSTSIAFGFSKFVFSVITLAKRDLKCKLMYARYTTSAISFLRILVTRLQSILRKGFDIDHARLFNL